MHLLQRFSAGHELEGIVPGAMWTDIALEGTLLDQDSRSMIDQSKIGVTRPSVDTALGLQNENMPMGKGSMLSRSRCLRPGGVEVSETRLLPDGRIPKIPWTSGLKGLRVRPTKSPTVLLTRTRTGGITVVKLASSRIDTPPLGVGDREPPSNDDRADVAVIRAEGEYIYNLEGFWLRIGLKSTEMLMRVLPVGESTLHGESNRLCSHKPGGRVDDDIEGKISPVYIPWMGSLEVGLSPREELEHRHIEVMLMNVRIWRQGPVVETIRVKGVARG